MNTRIMTAFALPALCVLASARLPAADTSYKAYEIQISHGQTQDREVKLVIGDHNFSIQPRDGSGPSYHDLGSNEIKKFVYEYSVVPKVLNGLASSPLTSSSNEKRHWLTIQCEEGGKTWFVLLALDPADYKDVLRVSRLFEGHELEGAPSQ